MKRFKPRRTVTTLTRVNDAGAFEVRAGERVLGTVSRLSGEADDMLSGAFAHAPAFADHAGLFAALARAQAACDEADAGVQRAAITRAGIGVWHVDHDMRVDVEGSLVIATGRVRFRPTDAYVTMRTGGL